MGFHIPRTVFRILKTQDSGFQKQKLPTFRISLKDFRDSGIRIPLHEVSSEEGRD